VLAEASKVMVWLRVGVDGIHVKLTIGGSFSRVSTVPIINPFHPFPGGGKFEVAYAWPVNSLPVSSIQYWPTEVGATSPRKFIEFKEWQPLNADSPIVVTLLGMVIDVRESHPPVNIFAPIVVTPLLMVTEVRFLQPENAWIPMVVTLLGMIIEVREVQDWNAMAWMVVTPLPIFTEIRLEQGLNAEIPMVVTLFGMVTEVKRWLSEKELSSMVITLLGMMNDPAFAFGYWIKVVMVLL
jgi:hypothetical protein